MQPENVQGYKTLLLMDLYLQIRDKVYQYISLPDVETNAPEHEQKHCLLTG